ncbi:hypothetical protein THIARS_40101 [Thiomonas delicata]|uniref:Uncharacterized protein n=1 Tax=Thiomonas delicata TaxID=364030 RepID=A0A238CZR2_THIDL|nr:hypothetical protein THIARS_40101 [Thiomonas delicata]
MVQRNRAWPPDARATGQMIEGCEYILINNL